jgi:hypothetical protein
MIHVLLLLEGILLENMALYCSSIFLNDLQLIFW